MWVLEIKGEFGKSATFTLSREDLVNLAGFVTPVPFKVVNVATRVSVTVGKGGWLTSEGIEKVGGFAAVAA